MLVYFYSNLLSQDLVVLLGPRRNNLLSLVLNDPSFDPETIVIRLAWNLICRERNTFGVLLRGILSYLDILRPVLLPNVPIEATYIILEAV